MDKEIIFKLDNGKYSLYNKEGKKISSSEYDFIHLEGENVLVSKNGIIKNMSLKDFVNRLNITERVNLKNKIETENKIDLYMFEEDDKIGICDKNGDSLIPAVYDKIEKYTGAKYGKYYECYKDDKITLYDAKTMKKTFEFEYKDAYMCSNKCAIFWNDNGENIYHDFEIGKTIYRGFEKGIATKILYKEGRNGRITYSGEKCCSILFFKDKKGHYCKVYDIDNHEDITDKCIVKVLNGEGIIKYENDGKSFKAELAKHEWFTKDNKGVFHFGTIGKQKTEICENKVNKRR